MNKSIKILVCYHKQDILFDSDILQPIHVGASMSKEILDIQRDDEGVNISEKNSSFCELTAMYWAWKNCRTVSIVGLFHYRRFFDTSGFSQWRNRQQLVDPSIIQSKFESTHNYEKELENYDVILATPKYLSRSVFVSYRRDHHVADLEHLERIIDEYYPEYIDAYNKVMNSHHFSPFNMFIARWEWFDQYCEWLFGILFKLENVVVISEDKYQKRVFGFIAERLLNVYCVHHNCRIKYSPILSLDSNLKIKSNVLFQAKRICTSILGL